MRLIDADVAQSIADEELFCDEAGAVQFVLSHTPTIDAVPVVRCKDCKHSCLVGKGAKKLQICHNPESPWFDCEGLVEVADDFFCSYGEKDGDGK